MPFEQPNLSCAKCGTSITNEKGEAVGIPYSKLKFGDKPQIIACTKCASGITEEETAKLKPVKKEPITKAEYDALPLERRIWYKLWHGQVLTPAEEEAIDATKRRPKPRSPQDAFAQMIGPIPGTGNVDPETGRIIAQHIGAVLLPEEWDELGDIYEAKGRDGLWELVPKDVDGLPQQEWIVVHPSAQMTLFDRCLRHVVRYSRERKERLKLDEKRKATETALNAAWEKQSIPLKCGCRLNKLKAYQDIGLYLGRYGLPARLKCSVHDSDWDYEAAKKLVTEDNRTKR